MARAALIATRGPLSPEQRARLDAFLPRLAPDNIAHAPWTAVDQPDLWIRGDASSYDVAPEQITVRADHRTMWWAKTESLFVASTSQRIVACAIGALEVNRATIAWMLSSGTLGPNGAWDRRVQPLAPNGTLILDRKKLHLDVREPPITFAPRDDRPHEQLLITALEEVFAEVQPDPAKWILPLSGGFDSRALLLLSPKLRALKTITWGTRAARADDRSDAAIAHTFASRLGVANEYFELDLSTEPIERIFDRYLIAGEGRVDHFSGYLDGFRLWRALHERGVEVIVRGDEGFGWVPVASESDVVHSVGMPGLADFAGAPSLNALGLEGVWQRIPPDFMHRAGESLETWRDRLYHRFRIPAILSALDDLKSPYVSVRAPLLDPRLLALVRAQPDALRTGKALFKKIVRARDTSGVPFATRSANADPAELLASPQMTEMLSDVLSSARARSLFNSAMLIPRPAARLSLRRRATRFAKTQAREMLPVWMRRAVRNRVAGHRLDARALALRAFLATRMLALLEEDARFRP